jgi:hypothetical protein
MNGLSLNGNATFGGSVTATTFTGNLNGIANNSWNLAGISGASYARLDTQNTFGTFGGVTYPLANIPAGTSLGQGISFAVLTNTAFNGNVLIGPSGGVLPGGTQGVMYVRVGTTFERAVDFAGAVRAATFTGSLSGNANTATTLATSRDFSISGDVTAASVSFNGGGNVSLSTTIANGAVTNAKIASNAAIEDSKLATISTANKVSNSATTATSSNNGSTIVLRDGSGNFSAGTITATLGGTADNATTLANVAASNYARRDTTNTFSSANTFSDTVTVNGGATFSSISAFGTLGGVTFALANIPAGTSLGQGISFTVLTNAAFNGNVLIGPSGGQIVGGTTQGVLYVRMGTTFERAVDFAGAVRAATFTGNLGGTADNATTLANVAASNYARRDTTNTFTGLQTLNAGLSAAGAITLNGAAALNAATTVNNTLTITGSAANTTFDTVGNATIGATLTVNGNFFVAGTVTTVNRTDLEIDDKIVVLGRTLDSNANISFLNGSGLWLGLSGTAQESGHDYYLLYQTASDSWESGRGFNVKSTQGYKINGVTAIGPVYASSANNGVLFRNTTGQIEGTAAGTNGQILFANASGVPVFASPTGLTVGTANKVKVQDRNTTTGTMFLTFVADASDAQDLWIDKASGITFDANTNLLSCTQIEATIDGGVWS